MTKEKIIYQICLENLRMKENIQQFNSVAKSTTKLLSDAML